MPAMLLANLRQDVLEISESGWDAGEATSNGFCAQLLGTPCDNRSPDHLHCCRHKVSRPGASGIKCFCMGALLLQRPVPIAIQMGSAADACCLLCRISSIENALPDATRVVSNPSRSTVQTIARLHSVCSSHMTLSGSSALS